MKNFTVRLPKQDLDQIATLARKARVTKGEYIRIAIKEQIIRDKGGTCA